MSSKYHVCFLEQILFLNSVRDVCIHQDKRIHLTVVYFGKEGLSQVKSILESVTRLVNNVRSEIISVYNIRSISAGD